MRLIFAGTPAFAQCALSALIAQGHEVVLVLTQPDRPSGRGLRLQASEVKQTAVQHAIALQQPLGLRLDGRYASDAALACQAMQRAVEVHGAQAMVVAAYGLILPEWVLRLPPLGCINIHASLLPRWRGAAPIHRAVAAGDTCTGITIMQMDSGLDTGAILKAQALPIAATDTTGTLHDKLAILGAQLCHEVLQSLACGPIQATIQPEQGVTYAAKIDKAEAPINWQESATTIARKIRAFNPTPGASAILHQQAYKFWSATDIPGDTSALSPGTITALSPQALDIATGSGLLRVTELQRAGSKRMPLADLLRGHPVQAGDSFAAA